MSAYVTIECDDCRRAGDDGPKAHIVRVRLKKLGWKVGLPGAKDYCPECVERRAWEKRNT